MEVAYITLSAKQLYVHLYRLGGGAKAILLPTYKIIGGGAPPVPKPMGTMRKTHRTLTVTRNQEDN